MFKHEVTGPTSLYSLTPPDEEAVRRRNEQVEALKKRMGDSYLLAKPVKQCRRRSATDKNAISETKK